MGIKNLKSIFFALIFSGMSLSAPVDHYEVLGIARNVKKSDIKEAYKIKALQYHPDKNPGGTEMFQGVLAAYEVLSDDELRAKYDSVLDLQINVGFARPGGFRPQSAPTASRRTAPGNPGMSRERMSKHDTERYSQNTESFAERFARRKREQQQELDAKLNFLQKQREVEQRESKERDRVAEKEREERADAKAQQEAFYRKCDADRMANTATSPMTDDQIEEDIKTEGIDYEALAKHRNLWAAGTSFVQQGEEVLKAEEALRAKTLISRLRRQFGLDGELSRDDRARGGAIPVKRTATASRSTSTVGSGVSRGVRKRTAVPVSAGSGVNAVFSRRNASNVKPMTFGRSRDPRSAFMEQYLAS